MRQGWVWRGEGTVFPPSFPYTCPLFIPSLPLPSSPLSLSHPPPPLYLTILPCHLSLSFPISSYLPHSTRPVLETNEPQARNSPLYGLLHQLTHRQNRHYAKMFIFLRDEAQIPLQTSVIIVQYPSLPLFSPSSSVCLSTFSPYIGQTVMTSLRAGKHVSPRDTSIQERGEGEGHIYNPCATSTLYSLGIPSRGENYAIHGRTMNRWQWDLIKTYNECAPIVLSYVDTVSSSR